MENKITCLTEFFDWIDNSKICCVSEKDDDYFYIETPNNGDVFINIEKDDNIDDIISRTINVLQKFDVDERFTELWNKDFAEHNHFKPSQFFKMLQEDEASFKELAGKLENMWH